MGKGAKSPKLGGGSKITKKKEKKLGANVANYGKPLGGGEGMIFTYPRVPRWSESCEYGVDFQVPDTHGDC